MDFIIRISRQGAEGNVKGDCEYIPRSSLALRVKSLRRAEFNKFPTRPVTYPRKEGSKSDHARS
jgi:hypothetical protein